MRESLYFKDDDARLSFLTGSYITMTNLSEREKQRIIDLRISPINVSVHATDPALRAMLLGNPRAAQGFEDMRRFAAAGIKMNCQIVACPGINDGPALQRTLTDLSDLYPGVSSVAVVPVGLTRYREGLYPLRMFTPEEAAAVIDLAESFGGQCLEKFGTRLVYCSDEFYLQAGRALPPDGFYEEYAQLENGVGMLRSLQQEFCEALAEARSGRMGALSRLPPASPPRLFSRNSLTRQQKGG
jgi:putative radical SAM enzyme (TIGR03279 family)